MARKFANFAAFASKLKQPLALTFFLLKKLPAAYFSGVKMKALDEEKCVVTLKQKWFNKNPFGSIYFACLSMAAEFSTGVLCMGYAQCQILPIRILVSGVEATFMKRAKGKITFICKDGLQINNDMVLVAKHGKPVFHNAQSYAVDETGDQIASFIITWQFKPIIK
jgi:hypothetical protein